MADCEDLIFYSPKDKLGGIRKETACEPVATHVPNELREPQDEYTGQPTYELPPVRVFNIEKSARCSDIGAIGDPGKDVYIVQDSALFKDVNIRIVDDIPSSVLDYIRTNNLISVIQDEAYSRNLQPEWLVKMTGMKYEQAQRLVYVIQSEQNQLDVRAQAIADTGIECYYVNNQQAMLCDMEYGSRSARDLFGDDFTEQQIIDYFNELDDKGKRIRPYSDLHGGVMYHLIPPGIIKSGISEAEADRLALQAANAALVCLFVNPLVTVDCRDHERPDKPAYGGNDPVPTPTEQEWQLWVTEHHAEGYNLRRPVGTVVIPEGTIVSYQSQDDAEQRARQLGWSRLVCYYINDRQEASCEDEQSRAYGIVPGPDSPPQDADIAGNKKGQRVVVPEGYIQSEISIQQANEKAIAITQVLLECCLTNDEYKAECDPIIVRDEHGQLRTIYPADGDYMPEQAVTSYVVPAGTFFQCQQAGQSVEDIKEHLNQQAKQLAELQLVCYYCNEIVLPTCVPDWVVQAVTTGVVVEAEGGIVIPAHDEQPQRIIPKGSVYTLELPLEPSDIYNPYTGGKEDISQWSINATAGVPKNSICYKDYYPAQYVVEEVNEPVRQEGAECPFSNDLVIAGCLVSDPYQGGATPSGEPYIFYSQHTFDEEYGCISDVYSNPKTGSYIEVPAGTFVFTELDVPDAPRKGDPDYDYDKVSAMVKKAANAAALNMAKAMLYCVYANPVTYVSCDAVPEGWENELCGDMWWFSQELAQQYPGRTLFDGSPTMDNPIVIPYGMFQSRSSIQDVYNRMQVYTQSMVFCLYGNRPASCDCEEKGQEGTQYGGGEIPADVIIDQNPAMADLQAKRMACASVVCLELTVGPIGPVGPMGPAGPQGPAGPAGPPGQPGSCPGECMGVYT